MLQPWKNLEGKYYRIDVGTAKSTAMSSTANASTIYFCTDGSIVLNGVEMGPKYSTPDLSPYLKTDGSRAMTNTLKINTWNALEHTMGGYKVFFRNDGANFYVMLSNKNGSSFNSLRPIRIDIVTGDVHFCGDKLSVYHNGDVYVRGTLHASNVVKTLEADVAESDMVVE